MVSMWLHSSERESEREGEMIKYIIQKEKKKQRENGTKG